MAQSEDKAADGRLAENILYFARALRAAGMPVGPGSVLDALEAVKTAQVGSRDDFYWTLHAVFVKRHEHSILFDQAFRIFFRRRGYIDKLIAAMLPDICHGLRSIDEIRAADWLSRVQALIGFDRLAEIDRLAPADYELPNGKRHPLAYEPGNPPVLAVRIQEVFGMPETPRIAGGRVPLLLHLLGPNHRPQQVTADLASFWRNTYPTVKKELRRRYPKHSWPDDPLAARSTRSGLKRDTT